MNQTNSSANRHSIRSIAPPAAALGLALTAVALSLTLPSVPVIKTEQAPPGEFSAGRALRHLEIIAREPRPVSSIAHDRVRDYLVGQIRDRGLEPQVQKTTAVRAGRARACVVENVLARLPGFGTGKAVMLVAHYDSVPTSYGAGDAGSGVVTLIETLRALTSAERLRHDVIFLFSDAEEMGLMGAQAFVDEHPWARDVGVVLNFEARGTSGPSILFETGPGNAELIRQFSGAAPVPIATSLAYEIYRLMPNDTDFSVFKRTGLNGLNFAFIGSPWNYHTPLDSLANLDRSSVQQQGEHALALARRFGESMPSTTEENAVDFNLLGSRLVWYSERWLLPLHGAICLGCLGLIWLARKRPGLALPQIGPGTVIVFLVCILAAGLGVLLTGLLEQAHLRFGIGVPDSFVFNTYYLAGLASALLAVLAASYSWLRVRVGWFRIAIAAALVWSGLAAITGLAVPGASYIFTWPALFSVLSLLGFSLLPDQRSPAWVAACLAVLGVLPAALILPPLLSTLGVAMGLSAPIAAGAFLLVALGWFTAVPLVELVRSASRHLLTVLAAAAAVAFITIGAEWARTHGPSFGKANLQYVLDQDVAKAYWISGANPHHPWIDAVMPMAQPGHPHLKGKAALPFAYQETEVAPLAEPTVQVVADRVEGETRRWVLRVRCANRPLRLAASNDQIKAQVAINGKKLDRLAGLDGAGFEAELINPGDDGLELSLTVAPTVSSIALRIEAEYLGLPQLPSLRIPPRPSDLLPGRWGDTTRIRKTVRFD